MHVAVCVLRARVFCVRLCACAFVSVAGRRGRPAQTAPRADMVLRKIQQKAGLHLRSCQLTMGFNDDAA